MKNLIALAAAAALACGGALAQTTAPKIAVTSLVADQWTLTVYRGATGSNLANGQMAVKMSTPVLDISLMKAARDAIREAAPTATVDLLAVPEAGSQLDPSLVYRNGQPDTANVLVDALKKEGYTHLLTATKLRTANSIELANGKFDTNRGMLEGIGFYVDPSIPLENVSTRRTTVGLLAPYVYMELRLVDLTTLDVRSQRITSNSTAGAKLQGSAAAGVWDALTAEEKIRHLDELIRKNVVRNVPALFQAKQAPARDNRP